MEIVAIIFAILIAIVIIRAFSFLSPFILVAFVVTWAKEHGWSTEGIVFASVVLLVGGFAAYIWIMMKIRDRQEAKFYEHAENERKKWDEVYNKK